MNAPTSVILIAGWALTEQSLAPLVESLFPGCSPVAPNWECEAKDEGTSADMSVAMTSVASLSSTSRGESELSDRSLPSAYAAALASKLAEQNRPAILIGWSMGGMVALETAIHWPVLVRRLVLISSCAHFCPPAPEHSEPRSSPVRALIHGLHRDRPETLRRFFSLVHSGSDNPEQATEDLKQALRLDPGHLVHGLRYLQTVDLRSRLSAVGVPTLIAHGRKDQVISWQASKLLQDGIRDSELMIVDDGAHGLVATSPGILAPAILRFLHADPLLA